MNDLHTSDAHTLIREAARTDRALTESQLRHIHAARMCRFLAKHTGLPLTDVVTIYEETT